MAAQIVAGRRRLWIPGPLARLSVKGTILVRQLRRILPLLERVETVARPRLGFLTGRAGVQIVGAACTVIAVVLVLPIPFANLLPALSLVFFSAGLTRKDGLLVLAGYGLLIAATVVIALEIHGILLAFRHLRALF